jgi:alpha-L-rhamnosidase
MPPEKPELIHSQDPARRTDGALLSTAFYYRILGLLHGFALKLGRPDEAKAFAAEAVEVKMAFNAKFFHADSDYYANNTVTANLLPLCYGMVPEQAQKAVFQHIVDKTLKDFDGHVSCGLVGIQWLMRGLTMYGRPDLAFRIVNNRTYPSWGYMIAKGATTIWELWNGDTADPAMNSGNHVMLLGDLLTWFYEDLAGIRNQPGGVAFKTICMKPYPVKGLDWVRASFRSPYGTIASHWQKEDGHFVWEVVVPPNTKAELYYPLSFGGKPQQVPSGARFVKEADGYALYEIGSGTYRFS